MLDFITVILDFGWVGPYRDLARLCGSHPLAVGACVRAYSRRHPAWEHDRVYALRTGKAGNKA